MDLSQFSLLDERPLSSRYSLIESSQGGRPTYDDPGRYAVDRVNSRASVLGGDRSSIWDWIGRLGQGAAGALRGVAGGERALANAAPQTQQGMPESSTSSRTWSTMNPAAVGKGERSVRQAQATNSLAHSGGTIVRILASMGAGGAMAGGGGAGGAGGAGGGGGAALGATGGYTPAAATGPATGGPVAGTVGTGGATGGGGGFGSMFSKFKGGGDMNDYLELADRFGGGGDSGGGAPSGGSPGSPTSTGPNDFSGQEGLSKWLAWDEDARRSAAAARAGIFGSGLSTTGGRYFFG